MKWIAFLLDCESLSFILNTVSFLGVYFAYIFSHLVACLLIFLAASFEKQTFRILMNSNLLIFCVCAQFILFNESLSLFKSLEKEMANHSSTLAWKIPWMEESGRLQSMAWRRVGHDWVSSLHLFNSRLLRSVLF